MIKIGVPYIEKGEEYSKLNCNVIIGEKENKIWLEVDKIYNDYLCTERCDAYVIGVLNYAMRNHMDITSEIPITGELLYNINRYLIPSLAKHDKSLYATKIIAPIADSVISNVGAVGTGFSGGVDSLHAILTNTNNEFKSLNVTYLLINNSGAFVDNKEMKQHRYKVAEDFAQEMGLTLIKTESNFEDVVHQSHFYTHTYSSMFVVYCLQKLWKVYYYGSSGEDFSEFSVVNSTKASSTAYELLSLNCFSNSKMRIYSEGGALTRFEKTNEIVDFPVAQKYLHTCLREKTNCSKCIKCMRTIITLDVLGKLNLFSDVYDIDYYKKHKNKFYLYLYKAHLQKDSMIEPVFSALKKNISIFIKLFALISIIAAKIFTITNDLNRAGEDCKSITILGFNFMIKKRPKIMTQ